MKSLSSEIKVKVMLLGNGGVGKTSIASRYTHGHFSKTYKPSLGVDFMVKREEIDDQVYKVMVFDTAGQEFISSLRKRYYAGAAGAVIVYDITRRKTLEDLDRWVEEVVSEVGDIRLLFVGNKFDLEDQREITKEEGQAYAEKHNSDFLETSALLGEGMNDIFLPFINMVRENTI